MYLKKVEIHGFKSFADKIEVIFEKGITGIVGPNGSGKSNISDAVRWVLGEQSAKTLRGSKMEDIIFAGTAHRKPVGMAEVSLTLDNGSNKLPIDYGEVTVTRRVYRSGESEYYINKSLCRLKDIKEIFMDTGVGVDGYSIIGQGKIDEILHNKSGDRRLLFEEAAGIVKYKTRKEEAEKKLENTNKNLLRVDDIIREIEQRIDPLKVQSEKAKTFLGLREQLKDLEMNVFVHEMDHLKYDIEALKEQSQIIQEQLNGYLEDKRKIQSNHEVLKIEMEGLDEGINQLKNNIFETIHSIEKKEGELGLCKEKVSNTEKNIERLKNEITENDENKEVISEKVNRLNKNYEEMGEELNSHRSILTEKMNSLNHLFRELKQQEEDMETSKGNVIEIMNDMATKKSEIHSLTVLQTNITKRQNQIDNEMSRFVSEKKVLIEKQVSVNDEFASVETDVEDLKNKKDLATADIEKLRHVINDMRKKEQSIKQKLHQNQTRKNLLEEMKNEYEGFHKSVKNTLIHIKKNPMLGEGIFGVVAELLDVPKGLEIAVEVALGSSMQNIVCSSPEDANRVIHYLKKNNLGRVTFLPIETVKGNDHAQNIKDEFKNAEGFIGRAVDLIQVGNPYRKILNYLLGRVVFVDRIENGIILSKKAKNKYKMVSLEGDVINPGGAITGGSYQAKSTNILSRKREIEDLKANIAELKDDLEEQTLSLSNEEKRLDEIESKVRINDDLLKEREIALINLRNDRNQLFKEIENHEGQIKRLHMEEEQLMGDYEETQGSIQEKIEKNQWMESEKKKIENEIAHRKSSYEDERDQRESLNNEVTNLKIQMASLEERKQNLYKNIEDIKSKAEELIHLKITKEKEMAQLIRNKESLTQHLEKLKIELKDADVLKQQYEFNITQEKLKKEKANKLFDEAEGKLKKINGIISELQDSLHKIEVKLTRLEMQQETYSNKLWEEYEVTYVQALEYKKENINISEATRMIKSLKNKIKNLGSVNLNSIKEYEEVTERHEFLVTQKEDLLNAKESLNKVIKEMEITMKAQFIESFQKINENFNEVFKKLFGGGRAELKLEDESEILTTGIEIIAQPPGKKLQNLSLLSGGERALTAISLLFAILKVKPTPFCILDEIEAALDDANVYRYADFLKEFSAETQFIVVTHRKGTMESVDALYGITMEEYGVSKLVSVKLSEKAS